MFRHLRAFRPSMSMAISLLALAIATAGTAAATVPTVFSIGDHATPAHTATVNAAGQLATTGTVSGAVTQAPPKSPFNFTFLAFEDSTLIAQMSAGTSATVALTGIRIANSTVYATDVSLVEYGVTSGGCAPVGHSNFLGQFSIPAGETADEQMVTPVVLKPLSAAPTWCLFAFANGANEDGFYITYNGYVVSGSYAPSTSPSVERAARHGHVTRKNAALDH